MYNYFALPKYILGKGDAAQDANLATTGWIGMQFGTDIHYTLFLKAI